MKEGFILKSPGGFTLMEVLIAMFLFAVATVAIVGVSVLVSKTSFQVERQVVAQAMANDVVEKLHGLPYSKVGLCVTQQSNAAIEAQGGIECTETIQQAQQEYTVITDIVPVDDPANGTVAGSLSFANADYKSVRVQVAPTLGGVVSGSAIATSVVSTTATVANWPPGVCVPGEVDACSVSFSALPATFTFANDVQMRTFVNSFGLYTKSPDASDATLGRMYNDSATRTKICNLKGYSAVQSYTSGTNSPVANYTNTKWDTSTSSFINYAGNLPTNSYIATLICNTPTSTAACSYKVVCPVSGNCTDAQIVRGYTPKGARYASTCKSPADCDTGYTCNTTTGACQVAVSPTCP